MELKCESIAASHSKSQCLVLFASSTGSKMSPQISLDIKGKELSGALALIQKSFSEKRFKGAAKDSVFFRDVNVSGFESMMVVGLGDKKDISEETIRSAGAIVTKTLTKEKMLSATVAIESLRRLTSDAAGSGRALSEGLLLASYKYDELKSKPKGEEAAAKAPAMVIKFALADKAALMKFADGVDLGEIMSEATNFSRDLGNGPGNYITPTNLAERARTASKGLPIKFQALNKKQIEALKMGSFLGVNQGSTEEPRFIIMEYFGAAKSKKPVVLVGKGLTFDTGGISIKPGAAMEEMKFDMCGGAAVIGTILALAKMKAKVNVVALVPSTDNMPDGNSMKPGDVLTSRNGKTIEVNNTDAEGRLILCDALVYACDHYEPAAIIDAATLTGACVVALGNVFAGFFCKDKNLLKKINEASISSGEKIWQLPLVDAYVDDMKGTYADLSNIAMGVKGGGSSQGAAFLSQFVTEGIPWAHFDIAATAWHLGGRYNYNPDRGASGFAVRLFADLVLSLA